MNNLIEDKIGIDETENPEIISAIKNGIIDYNSPFFGTNASKPITIYVTDNTATVIAGLTGFYNENYMRVDLLWVHKGCRYQGLGRKIMTKLEAFCTEKKCSYIQLDTFDFQARPFYEKLGFQCIGTIPKWVEDQDCHFMRKILI